MDRDHLFDLSTMQGVFDHVAVHLAKQAEPAIYFSQVVGVAFGTCRFRGDNGTKCAAGWLIPDNVYDAVIEDDTVDHLLEAGYLDPQIPNEARFASLIGELQAAHDDAAFKTDYVQRRTVEDYRAKWSDKMHDVAKFFDLDVSVLKAAVLAMEHDHVAA